MQSMPLGFRSKLDKYIDVGAAFNIKLSKLGGLACKFFALGADDKGQALGERFCCLENTSAFGEGSVKGAFYPAQADFKLDLSRCSAKNILLGFYTDGPKQEAESFRAEIYQNGPTLLQADFAGAEGFKEEKAAVLLSFYYKDGWRLARVGQGFSDGIEGLCRHYLCSSSAAALFKTAAPSKPQPVPAAGNSASQGVSQGYTVNRGFRSKLADKLDVSQPVEVCLGISGKAVYDFSCFGVDKNNKLSDDRYMIFFNQLASPKREITLNLGGSEARFGVNLAKLPNTVEKLVFTVSIDGAGSMNNIVSHDITVSQNGKAAFNSRYEGGMFQAEKAIISLEIYKKEVWRINFVGQGFDGGLSELLKHYGGEEIAPPPASSAASAKPIAPASAPVPAVPRPAPAAAQSAPVASAAPPPAKPPKPAPVASAAPPPAKPPRPASAMPAAPPPAKPPKPAKAPSAGGPNAFNNQPSAYRPGVPVPSAAPAAYAQSAAPAPAYPYGQGAVPAPFYPYGQSAAPAPAYPYGQSAAPAPSYPYGQSVAPSPSYPYGQSATPASSYPYGQSAAPAPYPQSIPAASPSPFVQSTPSAPPPPYAQSGVPVITNGQGAVVVGVNSGSKPKISYSDFCRDSEKDEPAGKGFNTLFGLIGSDSIKPAASAEPASFSQNPAPYIAPASSGGQSGAQAAICPVCGAKSLSGCRFCEDCGAPLPEVGAVSASPAPASSAANSAVVPSAASPAPAPVSAHAPAPKHAAVPSAIAAPLLPTSAGAGYAPAPAAAAVGKIICAACGNSVPADKYCEECGAELSQAAGQSTAPTAQAQPVPALQAASGPVPGAGGKIVCPVCGYSVRPDKYCEECGSEMAVALSSGGGSLSFASGQPSESNRVNMEGGLLVAARGSRASLSQYLNPAKPFSVEFNVAGGECEFACLVLNAQNKVLNEKYCVGAANAVSQNKEIDSRIFPEFGFFNVNLPALPEAAVRVSFVTGFKNASASALEKHSLIMSQDGTPKVVSEFVGRELGDAKSVVSVELERKGGNWEVCFACSGYSDDFNRFLTYWR